MKYSLDELYTLPLFLGMGKGELASLHKHITLKNSQVKRKQMIVEEGAKCTSLIIIMTGSFLCTTTSSDKSYSITELLHAPFVVQPERVFGLTQHYSVTIQSKTPCQIMIIEKQMVLRLMEISMTFRINMLNLLSTQSQRMNRNVWHVMPEQLEKRIIRFVINHVVYPAGCKYINIKMNDLARELGCSRLEASQALHSLEEKELIIMRRGKIEIPMLQQVINNGIS